MGGPEGPSRGVVGGRGERGSFGTDWGAGVVGLCARRREEVVGR